MMYAHVEPSMYTYHNVYCMSYLLSHKMHCIIVERGDAAAVTSLLELVLGCAVQCAKKEEYITLIASSPHHVVKADLMAVIQRVLSSMVPADTPLNSPGGVFTHVKCVHSCTNASLR